MQSYIEEHLYIEDITKQNYEPGVTYVIKQGKEKTVAKYDTEYNRFYSFKHKQGYVICILKIDLHLKEVIVTRF